MTTNEQIAALASQSNISMKMVEATIGHSLSPEEKQIFLKAKTVAELKRAQKKARGPMSSAERVRKHNAKANDIGEIPPCANPSDKEACRFDLEHFGWTYCREFLKHRASEKIKRELILPIQSAILSGGQIGDMFGRGTGKTTWVQQIAGLWAALYGHRRFLVMISASKGLAKKNLKNVKRLLLSSKKLAEDFPAEVLALQQLGGVSQRAASQTYHGEPTEIEWGSEQIRFPVLRAPDGSLVGEGCGAIIAVTGIGGAIRGANEGGQRPDYLILDDPQTKADAASPSSVKKIIEYIESDALMLAGHDRVISAFITITPQRFGDVAYELASDRHPEWEFRVCPFIDRFPPRWDKLVTDFCAVFYEDLARHDQAHKGARDWYLEHRDEFKGISVVDELQFDPKMEVDVVHHLLNLRAKIGERSFNAEILMQVADINTQISINTDIVTQATNGFPRLKMPPGISKGLVAFADINSQAGKGISWVVVAFGKKRAASVVAYGRYPEDGSALVLPNASEQEKVRGFTVGMKNVAKEIALLDIRDSKNVRRFPKVLGFDRGFEPAIVQRVLMNLRQKVALPFALISTKGVGDTFRPRKDEIVYSGDHVWGSNTELGEYITVVSAYWREKMQSGFLETPLMPGSLSLYGTDPIAHATIANEICAERLMRRYFDKQGRVKWDWIKVSEDNHFGDALTQAFALASYYRLYAALPSVIDDQIEPRKVHADDLFDPNRNAAIVANSGEVESGKDDEIGEAGNGERGMGNGEPLSTPVYKFVNKRKKAPVRRARFKR